ncbi:MAG: site-specific integrase [Actinobacteria bacterium]|nr:site-specific integrase [Actinomycetota bacterium]
MTAGYGPDGKQKRKSFYGKTRAEALNKMTRAIAAAKQGIPPTNDRQTVGQFLNRWLEDHVKRTVRPGTYARAEQAVRLHLQPRLGRIRLIDLTPKAIQNFMSEKIDEGLSPRSVQILHANLRAALNRAVLWGEVPRNVARLVQPPRSETKPVQPFSIEEAKSFLEAVQGHRLEALFTVAITCGRRQGEILAVRWQDIDLDEGSLSVRYALGRKDGKYCLVEPKTRQSRRTIALPAIALNALKAHHEGQQTEDVEVKEGWENLVFLSEHGQPLNGCVVGRQFRLVLKAAGLRAIRFHDLRHSCCSLLVAQGVHPRLIMESLGHSDISISMSVYAHVLSELRRETALQMDAVLSTK